MDKYLTTECIEKAIGTRLPDPRYVLSEHQACAKKPIEAYIREDLILVVCIGFSLTVSS